MNTDFFLSWQSLGTIAIVLAIGIWQLLSVRRSRRLRAETGHTPAGDPGKTVTGAPVRVTGVDPTPGSSGRPAP